MKMKLITVVLCGVFTGVDAAAPADSLPQARQVFTASIKPLLKTHCIQCHDKRGDNTSDVILSQFNKVDSLLADPELTRRILDALDSGAMPPEDESRLMGDQRQSAVTALQVLLRLAKTDDSDVTHTPVRRMTRFQYNNAVQDLLQLDVEVFTLTERMMREYGNYYQPASGKMPDQVTVGSRPLGKSQLIERRLGGVTPYPQDLRAEHGFDTQADHLTLSPLMLESFMKLGLSIVHSPDFNRQHCGIWDSLFEPPTGSPLQAEIENRLREFLTRAFRRTIDPPVLARYVAFAQRRIRSGSDFTEAMKAVVAAALASPQFFYLYDTDPQLTASVDDYELASKLSFFLWGSIPDQELIDLAANGELHRMDVLSAQVDRMLDSELSKRFCDSFPAQWLQLERIISSAPDPKSYADFYFSKYNVSMHMMIEPLLLFETVLVENQSILQFIDSDFSYRSGVLSAWYNPESKVPVQGPVTLKFRRVPVSDRRQGGMFTNAAVMTMTSNATETQPITRGAWFATVMLNTPPKPPPANVPLLAADPETVKTATLRERFAVHQANATCAACHQRIDPLGFALENYDPVGMWRDTYRHGQAVDSSGTLLGKHEFTNVVEFKDAMLLEKDRFTKALAGHLMSYALGRKLGYSDAFVLDDIVTRTAAADYRFRSLIKSVVLSESFNPAGADESVMREPLVRGESK